MGSKLSFYTDDMLLYKPIRFDGDYVDLQSDIDGNPAVKVTDLRSSRPEVVMFNVQSSKFIVNAFQGARACIYTWKYYNQSNNSKKEIKVSNILTNIITNSMNGLRCGMFRIRSSL